jgi:2-polyprenyl-6-methoxyphenol hydroxylase-like FAD-dependent oxidoreductase
MTGGRQEGDDEFEVLTGRRAVVEAALARLAASTHGIEVRRGVAVAGLLTNGSAAAGVPHVVGVKTEEGEEIPADLVVDASGRRSPLPKWLEAIGSRPPYEELEDSGFVYYGRTFRSPTGELPVALGGPLQHYDSVSTLCLAADNGTWAVALIAGGADRELRKLRDLDTWTKVWRSYPLVAHWVDGEPLEPEVQAMAKIEDRYRRFVVEGMPVATGVAAVGDSWACTNPSVGRGASMSLLHACTLRDLIRAGTLGDPVAFALAWDEATETTLAPWYRDTLWIDRHRLAEIDASIAGTKYDPGEPKYELYKALGFASALDPAALRAGVRNAMLQTLLDDVIEELGPDRLLSAGGGWRDAPSFGAGRDDLLKVVA